MPNLRRSMSYLWRYRVRLALAIGCVVVISVLWGGGLGMIGPGARLVMDEQGLHGWAYGKLASDHLGAKLSVIMRPALTGRQSESDASYEALPLMIITVGKVSTGGPANRAGIQAGQWIVGKYSTGAGTAKVRGDELLQAIAEATPTRKLALRVFNPVTRHDTRVELTPAVAKWDSRLLARLVRLIPKPKNSADRYRIFLGLLVVMLVITYVRDIFRFFQEYLVATAVYRGIIDLRQDMYDVALRLPMTFYTEKGTTDTMSRFVKDTNALSRAQSTLFSRTLAEPAKAIAALTMAFMFSWKLTLLAMIAGPPTLLMIHKFGKRIKRASKKALQGWAGLLAVLEETLNGIRVVKVYTMEGTEKRRFFRANRRVFHQQRKMARTDAATGPTVEALGITAAVGAGALGGYWIFSGQMDTADFLGTMACLAAVFDPLRKLAKVVNRFQRAESAAARIFQLQDQPQERSAAAAPMLPRHSRDIEFRNVHYRYPGLAEDTLSDINLRISAGQNIAIVGPNGCGKTTLISLLPRLLDPTAGQVLIDGHDVVDFSIRSLRRQIALVTQDTVLFNATIGQNIAYGLRRPKNENVLAAARQAFVDEFVRDLPEGYDTMVGEHGTMLSGGQKQRIAIARAILRDPAILIFDEATSQIDSDSESRIHQAMVEFMAGRTTLLIAHRFATVLQADAIVVMNSGKVIDVGTHAELMSRCELYSHLYDTQLADAGAG